VVAVAGEVLDGDARIRQGRLIRASISLAAIAMKLVPLC